MKYFTATVVCLLYCLFQPLVLFYVQLPNLQNRGGLTYPNYQFVSFFKKLADIATTEILSYLPQENICKQLVTILLPHLIRNSLFICNTHKDKICKVSYPTSTRRHGNFAGVHTLLRIILSSNSAVLINIITGVSPPHFDFFVFYVLCQC
jgi:hypothetical protein